MRALGVIGGLSMLAACGHAPAPKSAETVTNVRVATIGRANAASAVEGVGTVRYRRETSLGFTSAGRIATVTVNEGDRIGKGQLLAALDTATVGATLSSAEAEAARAEAELTRSEKLFADGWVTRPRVDNARAALAAARANVRSAGFQVTNARIYAPSAGVVLARSAEPAQVVGAGQSVVLIGEAAGGMVLRVPVTDRDAARLTVGAPAIVKLAALGGAPITGQLIEIAGRADRTTGTFDCLIALPEDARLRVGQVGSVAIVAQSGVASSVTAPATAVFNARAGEGFVYIADGDRIRLRKVTLGEANATGFAVNKGLVPGERVVVSGVDRLRNGQKVAVVSAAR